MKFTHRVLGHTRRGTPIFAIAGGSSSEPPPQQQGEGEGDTLQVPADSRAPDTSGGEQPPATPASSQVVDPNRFVQGASEQGTEPPAPQQAGQPAPQGRVFTEEEVERFRQQERDKLYGRIEEMDQTIKELRDAQQREQEEEERAQQEAEEQRRAQEEEELDVRALLQKKEQEWNEKFSEIEQRERQQAELLEKERQFNALQEYKRNQVEANEERIMPQLRDLITGNTEEEINASIQAAIEKTESIMGDVAAATQAQRQSTPTARVTAPGDQGPLEQTEQLTRTYTAEELRNMPMSEYAKHRDKLLGGVSQKARQGGLYG